METTRTLTWFPRCWGALGGSLVATMSLSCTLVFDSQVEQCQSDDECSNRGFQNSICENEICKQKPREPIWGCLDDPPQQTSANVFVELQLLVATPQGAAVTTAIVRACSRLESSACNNPLGGEFPVDPSGKVRVPVPQNFNGYLEMFDKDSRLDYNPKFIRSLVFFPTREVIRGAEGRGIFVVDENTVETLAALGGGTFDQTTGLVGLVTLNCQSDVAPGVSYGIPNMSIATPLTKGFYTFDMLPAQGLTETDKSGLGGYTNITAGPAAFTATLNAQQRLITDVSGTGVFVRAGWYTQVYIAP